MKSYLLRGEADIQLMQDLIAQLPYPSTVIDFEETMLLNSVKAATRLWQHNGQIVAFAFVDDYNNLRFEIEADSRSAQIEKEIIEWGITCIQERNAKTGENHTLDASFSTENTWQIAMLEKAGFVPTNLRTLRYARSLS